MGDTITYSEMTFTNKHNSRISSGFAQNEDVTTYAAVKNKSEGKKKTKSNTKSNLTQQVSPQPDAPSVTYALVNKQKKEADKNKKPVKTEEVSRQAKDISLLYTAINKPKKSAQKENTTTTKTTHAYEDVQMLRESTGNGHIKAKKLLFTQVWDGRHMKLLVGVLITVCLILLITVVCMVATKGNGLKSDSKESGTSESNGQSGRSPRCPDLWIPTNNMCYFFSEMKKSHSESSKDCAERDSSLAPMKEKTIQRLVTITGKEFWVGISHYTTQGGVWTGRWTNGSLETVTEGTGSCAKLGSRLTLENCYSELNFICGKGIV